LPRSRLPSFGPVTPFLGALTMVHRLEHGERYPPPTPIVASPVPAGFRRRSWMSGTPVLTVSRTSIKKRGAHATRAAGTRAGGRTWVGTRLAYCNGEEVAGLAQRVNHEQRGRIRRGNW
jgi:hypothetical protein